jgi:hypothetical protein
VYFNTKRVTAMSESEREDRIRQRAYERYVERGDRSGGEVDDWAAAEEELFHATGPSHPDMEQPEAPNRDDAQTPPRSDDDKIDEAIEESFPASDAPSWRGGTSAA